MIQLQRFRYYLLFTSIVFVLITLSVGLKPRGFRFVNQVQWLEEKKSLEFYYIGMMYSEKGLGEIGITDSIGIITAIRPYRINKRRMQRIVSLVNDSGHELFTIDEYTKLVEATLWDIHGNPVLRETISNALSADSVRYIAAGITDSTIWIQSDNGSFRQTKKTFRLPPHNLKQYQLLFGYGASGNMPWVGELTGLAIVRGTTAGDRNMALHDYFYRSCNTSGQEGATDIAALFSFPTDPGQLIANKCGSDWRLKVPKLMKFFKYNWIQPLPKKISLSRSTVSDMIINFIGFIPLGCVFYLLFISFTKIRQHPLLISVFSATTISIIIEVTQVFIPTRTSQLIDILLNGGGACIGALMIRSMISIATLKKWIKIDDH